MRIVAVDPGTRLLGLALNADGAVTETRVLDVAALSNGEAARAALAVGEERRAASAAIEVPGPWMRGKKASRSFEAIGRLYRLIGALEAVLPSPVLVDDSAVKMALTGRPSSRKCDVHRVVMLAGVAVDQLRRQTCADCRSAGYDPRHSPDAADAAALALYCDSF